MENDTVLRMIRQRADATWPDEAAPIGKAWESHWNAACLQLFTEMEAEGLVETAKAVLTHATNH